MNTNANMFWGLIMEPLKKYTQTVKKAFHISMASLDHLSATDDWVQVMCAYGQKKYLLCTLQKDKFPQCALDLNFDVGTEVSFITNGNSHVHLSGYLVQDDADDFDDMMYGDEEEEEADVSLGRVSSTNIVGGKRSKEQKAEGQQNGLPAKLSRKLADLAKNIPPAKKLKIADLLENIDDEDDEDDSDVDFSDLLAEEDDDDEGDTTMLDDEEEDDEDDDEAEEDDDEDEADEDDDEDVEDEDVEEDNEDDDTEEESEAEEEVIASPPQNGTGKTKKGSVSSPVKEVKGKPEKKGKPEAKTSKKIEGGVQIEDIRVGSGAPAKGGKMLQLHYEGRFKSGKMFDSATKGAGFKFRLGRGEVIKGWDVGLVGMKVGGKRRIVCPPNMAYGVKGSPPTIPPNSTLVFEVELKNVS